MNSGKKSSLLRRASERIFNEYKKAHQRRAGMDGATPIQKITKLAARIDAEVHLRSVIDEAFRYWIKNKRWPLMDEEHAWHVSQRFPAALDISSILEIHGWTCPQKSENDILDFLLISGWKFYGPIAQKARLTELRATR